ncbi:RagB/SusD family nutrient uptake outer membrane protein [Sphingobacterium griseoflavum]|uniref:Membrane protein n=1 Tax=Sphingobacterium griseoflavum TaxID=1474952 RepID=A0ABQ3HRK5_9SPHI|nr:RagB/SusD family nutrient uptake outer membrane protein [Sphingobacterium griseoflavum]GHE28535.1 membrane protein [Sphingobacterium griseoflavum]
MKKFKIKNADATRLFLGLALIAMNVRCKTEFLEKTPLNILSPETVFSTTGNAYAAINGMHRRMYSQWYGNQAMGGMSGNMIYMDALGEDMVMTAIANGFWIAQYRWLGHRDVNNSTLRANYGFFYALIANANAILVNIDQANGPQEDRDFIKAQAYTYRAWAYFNLVQMFGRRYEAGGNNTSMGMSLVTQPHDAAVPRSTVEQTYEQINDDLDQAMSLFEGGTMRPHKSHLTMNVAKGVKARVALTQGCYRLAAQMAKEAREGFPLMNRQEYMAGFSNIGNGEWIWGIQQREDQTTYFYSFFAYLGNFSSTNTRGNPKAINAWLYDQISESDIRKQLWDPTGSNSSFPHPVNGVRRPYMSRKFLLENPGNSNGDLCFMRAAEMLLIEAECLARLGEDDEAAAILYTLVNSRDPAYQRSSSTGETLVQEILIQRRIELWGEGFRWYDLKRLDASLNRNGANHIATIAQVFDVPAGSALWQFVIPQLEIDYTLGVVRQNPL